VLYLCKVTCYYGPANDWYLKTGHHTASMEVLELCQGGPQEVFHENKPTPCSCHPRRGRVSGES